MVGLLILLLTGFAVYYLIRHPVRSMKAVFVVLGLLLLGSVVWFGLIALVMKL
jgi:hypothetical protein